MCWPRDTCALVYRAQHLGAGVLRGNTACARAFAWRTPSLRAAFSYAPHAHAGRALPAADVRIACTTGDDRTLRFAPSAVRCALPRCRGWRWFCHGALARCCRAAAAAFRHAYCHGAPAHAFPRPARRAGRRLTLPTLASTFTPSRAGAARRSPRTRRAHFTAHAPRDNAYARGHKMTTFMKATFFIFIHFISFWHFMALSSWHFCFLLFTFHFFHFISFHFISFYLFVVCLVFENTSHQSWFMLFLPPQQLFTSAALSWYDM